MTNVLFITGFAFIIEIVVCVPNGDIISLIENLSAKIDAIDAKLKQKTKNDAVMYQNLQNHINQIKQSRSTREFKYESRHVTWVEAEEECIKWGGHLLTINSPKENEYFRKEIVRRELGERVWIGLNDIHQEGHFVWVSGKQSFFNANWYKGEPNGGRGENCVEMYLTDPKAGKWNDICCKCDYKQGFVCERYQQRL